MKNQSIKIKNNFYKKNICVLSDCFVPTKNSASGMIYNLSKSLVNEGAIVTCMHSGKNPIQNQAIFENYDLEGLNFITLDFLTFLRNKNIFLRFIFETTFSIFLSFKICINFNKIKNTKLIIWYGPSAFLWLPAIIMKFISKAPIYYILRDIFPDWLQSVGLIKNKILFMFLNLLTYPQYIYPDKIGIESPENLLLVKKKVKNKNKIEIMYNWPSIYNSKNKYSTYNFKKKVSEIFSHKKRKKILCVYTGNLSIAQDEENILKFLDDRNIRNLMEIYFFLPKLFDKFSKTSFHFKNAIPEFHLPIIFDYSNCGIVALNKNLKTNNIPGKFVSYTQFGLPILCFCDKNSKLGKLIYQYKCGIVIDYDDDKKINLEKIEFFCKKIKNKNNIYHQNSKKLFKELFDLKKVKYQLEKML